MQSNDSKPSTMLPSATYSVEEGQIGVNMLRSQDLGVHLFLLAHFLSHCLRRSREEEKHSVFA